MGLPLDTPTKKFSLSMCPLTSQIKELEQGWAGRWVSSSSSCSHGSSEVPLCDLAWPEFLQAVAYHQSATQELK